MKKLILLAVLSFSPLFHAPKALAFLGIPGTPSFPGDPGDTLRAAERAIKCRQIRDDADHHQAELRQSLARSEGDLNKTNQNLNENISLREKYALLDATLTKQNTILREFPNLSSGLVLNANDVKNAILNMIAKNSSQSLEEILQNMENNEDPTLRQLALFIHPLILKNNLELAVLLENERSHETLARLSILIGSSQALWAQVKSQVNNLISENELKILNAPPNNRLSTQQKLIKLTARLTPRKSGSHAGSNCSWINELCFCQWRF